jgi:hypothetical protein
LVGCSRHLSRRRCRRGRLRYFFQRFASKVQRRPGLLPWAGLCEGGVACVRSNALTFLKWFVAFVGSGEGTGAFSRKGRRMADDCV